MNHAANILRFVVTAKSRISRSAPSAQGFAWILAKLAAGEDISNRMEIRHAGTCGACGRPLTTPESIDTGLGPVCAARLGVPHGKGEAGTLDALRFVTAGNATITATSIRTGVSFTYRVVRAKGDDPTRPYFVKVLTGSDNDADYSYLGAIFVTPHSARRIEDAANRAEAAQGAPCLGGVR